MKSLTRHTGILSITKRLPSSANGNPRYQFIIDGYIAQTAVDSMHGYSITNYDGKEVTVTLGTHYGSLTLNTINGSV